MKAEMSRSTVCRRKRKAEDGFILAHPNGVRASDWKKLPIEDNLINYDSEDIVMENAPNATQCLENDTIVIATNNTIENEEHVSKRKEYEMDRSFYLKDKTEKDQIKPLALKKHVTEDDLLINILSIALKYNQSYEEILAYTRLLDSKVVHSHLPTTKPMLWKMLHKNDEAYQRHYFCGNCKTTIGQGNTITSNCPKKCRKSGMHSDIKTLPYFLSIDLQMQVADLLSIPNISTALMYRYTRKTDVNVITDVYDGIKYKELCAPGEFLHNKWNFSYIFNTDGASCSKSSNTSVWPIYVAINELPPHMRKRHVLLAGVWVHKEKPIANYFFKPFVEQANKKLYKEGVTWKPDGKSTVTSKLIPLIFNADSPARCQFLRMMQYNGNFGCTFCLIPGSFPRLRLGSKNLQRKKNSSQAKYPCDKTYPLRTHESIKEDGKNALEQGHFINGVQGPSVLGFLKGFKLDTGPVPDPMHFEWLGVIKQYISMCLDEVGNIPGVQKNHRWYIGSPKKMEKINEILLSIHMPSRVSRHFEDIKHYKKYKATAWRNLSYVFLICVEDFFPIEDLNHLALLFEASYICNQDKITAEELNRVERSLKEFLIYFQARHGLRKMTYNMHLLTHMVDSIRNWGPSWTHNATIFESMNHKILQSITSANGVKDQIATRFLMNRYIENCVYDPSVSLETRKQVAKLLNVRMFDEQITKNNIEGDILFKNLGTENKRKATEEEVEIFGEAGFACEEIITYEKVLINRDTERQLSKKKTSFSNCTVFCNDLGFGDVTKILSFEIRGKKVVGIFICRFDTLGNALNTTFIKNVVSTNKEIIVEASKISGPAFKVIKGDITRMIKLPNCWETD